jgi:HK97 family phage prohead protease
LHGLKLEIPPDYNRHDYTKAFLRDGKSSYHERFGEKAEILYKPAFEFKVSKADDEVFIEGWASTNAIDLDNEIIQPTAFTGSLNEYLNVPTVLFMHDWWAIPIGKCTTAEIRDDGLWVKIKIFEKGDAAAVKEGIIEGVLKMLSVGFRVKNYQADIESGLRTITDLQLLEISIVHRGANPFAFFSQTNNSKLKSLIKKHSPRSAGIMKEDFNMSGNGNTEFLALEHKVDDFLGTYKNLPSAVEKAEARLEGVEKKHTEFMKMIGETQDNFKKLSSGLITKGDLDTFAQNMKGDLTSVMDEVKRVKALHELKKEQLPFSTWQGMLKAGEYNWLRDDHGDPLSSMHQKAYHYFQAPIDYKGSSDGEYYRKMRQLYDVVLFTYAYKAGQTKGFVNIQNLKSYKLLAEMIGQVDPEFAKAMYSTGTGLGDEWVPTLMSAELQELMRIEPSLANYIPRFTMRSNPYEWPILSAGGTAYLADDATSNTPDELYKTDITTAKKTFTAKTHAFALPFSPQFVEDAIVEVVGALREETVYGLRVGEEKALINGDTTATHRDTTTVTHAADLARAFMGLRFLAIDLSNTFDTQSATAGVGDATTAFAAKDIRYTRQLCGKAAINPRDGLYVTSISVMFYMLSMSEFAKANEFGYKSTWYTGELPIVDGCELYVSDQMPETMGTTGLCNSASTHKGLLWFNKRRGFKIGEMRGITVEYDKNILTQQMCFVSTRRLDFQNMQPSSIKPVAYGYNIE